MAGIAGQKFISLPAYEAMWEQVLELTPEYDPKILRRYAPASKEVYGEVNPVLVSDFIKALKLSSQDVLYDLGSGVGNVVLQVAAQTGCVAVGVEIRSELTSIGQALLKNYQTLLRRTHLLRGEVQLVCGDILSPEVDLSKATVVFLNNYCFPQHLEQSVLKKFKAGLKNGVRIITLKDFAPRFRPTSTRFVKSYCHLFKFPWLKCRSSPDAVSWTDKSVEYFIYQVDRNNLARQKAFKEAAKKGLRLSDNLVCSLKDGEIVVEAAVPPPAAKGKGNESEENSDVEIGALMQAEFRGDSAKHLLHVLRGGHALTQMLKSLGCDTAKLEASNQRAGEKLKEAELNGDLDRADGARPRKAARKGQHSRSSAASSASSSTSPAVVLVATDDSFEELMERFTTWQAETRKKDGKRGRKAKRSKPEDQRETPVTLAALNDELKRWEKEVKLSKKRSTPHNVSTSGGSEWKALAADYAKWKRQHDTRQHSSSPSLAPDDPKTEEAAAVAEPSKSSSLWDQAPPTTGSTPVMEYSLPPGWVRKIRCEPGGRRRYKFISPTGRVFVSLKSAREHIDEERISRKRSEDTSDSSPATTPPTPRRYAKRRSEELRQLATAPNKKQRETKEEKEEEEKEEKHDDDNGDKDEDGATSKDGNSSMEAKANEEVEAGERRQGHYTPNNANDQLPEGWRRRKRGRYWTYTSPDGTLYRSRKQALLAVNSQSGVQIDSEEQQQREESEKKGEEDENKEVGQAAPDEGCVQTTTKRRLARRSAPAALERKRKQDMQREVEAKEAQEERSREASDTREDRCDRANIRRRVSNPGRGSSSSSSSSRETDKNVINISDGEEEKEEEEEKEKEEEEEKKEAEEEKRPQKKSRRQRELDRLRGWDQWREDEQKRKEELQRRIRERRSSSSTRSGDDN